MNDELEELTAKLFELQQQLRDTERERAQLTAALLENAAEIAELNEQ